MQVTVWIRLSWLLLILMVSCTPSSVEVNPATSTDPATLPPPLVSESSVTEIAPSPSTGKEAVDASSTPTGASGPAPTASPSMTGVAVATDRLKYKPGETILITINRDADAVIYPAPGEAGCPIITVQRFQADSWEPVTVCPWSGPDSAQSGLQMRDQAWGFYLDTQQPAGQGAGVGEPVAPDTFEGNVGDLPTLTPPPPGYSGPEVPRGPGRPDPGSPTAAALDPGTYRIVFSYAAAPDSVPKTAFSEPFVVED